MANIHTEAAAVPINLEASSSPSSFGGGLRRSASTSSLPRSAASSYSASPHLSASPSQGLLSGSGNKRSEGYFDSYMAEKEESYFPQYEYAAGGSSQTTTETTKSNSRGLQPTPTIFYTSPSPKAESPVDERTRPITPESTTSTAPTFGSDHPTPTSDVSDYHSVASEIILSLSNDDMSIRNEPIRHVDYLSHDWEESDIWKSWAYVSKEKNEYQNGARLENASWRTWAKTRYKLSTVSPATLNWLKDCDVTWLYGPLQPANSSAMKSLSAPVTPTVGNSEPTTPATEFPSSLPNPGIISPPPRPSLNSPGSYVSSKKPILKKRSMSELMLSQGARNLISTAASQVQKQKEQQKRQFQKLEMPPARPILMHTASDSRVYTSSSTSDSERVESPRSAHSEANTPGIERRRHIHFNDWVEQCIAVETPDESDVDENDEDSGEDEESDEDGGLVINVGAGGPGGAQAMDRKKNESSGGSTSSGGRPRPTRGRTHSTMRLEHTHTIAPLPPTSLKNDDDGAASPHPLSHSLPQKKIPVTPGYEATPTAPAQTSSGGTGRTPWVPGGGGVFDLEDEDDEEDDILAWRNRMNANNTSQSSTPRAQVPPSVPKSAANVTSPVKAAVPKPAPSVGVETAAAVAAEPASSNNNGGGLQRNSSSQYLRSYMKGSSSTNLAAQGRQTAQSHSKHSNKSRSKSLDVGHALQASQNKDEAASPASVSPAASPSPVPSPSPTEAQSSGPGSGSGSGYASSDDSMFGKGVTLVGAAKDIVGSLWAGWRR
ncbi:protein phosphatase regulator [Saitoella coloradoensis]